MHKRIVIVGLALVVVAAVTLTARVERETRNVAAEGAQRLDIKLEFAAGELMLASGDFDDAARLELEYDPDKTDYIVDYEVTDRRGHLFIESDHKRNNDIDTDDNRLNLTMSTRYPTRLEMDMGACDATLDLGGVPLEELNLDVGAASGDIEFTKMNPERCREINIDAGATSLDMHMIGNANFEEMNFSGGAGSFDLDFRGEYKGVSRVDLEIGLGSCDITLPEGVPVRIVSKNANWLSSVDVHEGSNIRQLDDDEWESGDFEGSDTQIILTLEVGLGSVDIYFK